MAPKELAYPTLVQFMRSTRVPKGSKLSKRELAELNLGIARQAREQKIKVLLQERDLVIRDEELGKWHPRPQSFSPNKKKRMQSANSNRRVSSLDSSVVQ